jgi:hypothetical protein
MGVNDDRAHALLQGQLSPHLSMGQPEFFVEDPTTIVRAGRRPVKRINAKYEFSQAALDQREVLL